MQASHSLAPKVSLKKLYVELRCRFGKIAHDLCRQKGVGLIEAMPNLIMCIYAWYTPKYSVANIVGLLKGKSSIRLNNEFSRAKSNGKYFWIRSYFVNTAGLNEKAIREYIKAPESIR